MLSRNYELVQVGVVAGLYMCDVVKKKFTFAISSPDEFLLLLFERFFNYEYNRPTLFTTLDSHYRRGGAALPACPLYLTSRYECDVSRIRKLIAYRPYCCRNFFQTLRMLTVCCP